MIDGQYLRFFVVFLFCFVLLVAGIPQVLVLFSGRYRLDAVYFCKLCSFIPERHARITFFFSLRFLQCRTLWQWKLKGYFLEVTCVILSRHYFLFFKTVLIISGAKNQELRKQVNDKQHKLLCHIWIPERNIIARRLHPRQYTVCSDVQDGCCFENNWQPLICSVTSNWLCMAKDDH